ncbi:hypothetical protein V4C53_30760 [Paraburkholderia azotifigens]|uniref:hypothetical protein n=1 Tax=Paraburkholderia azotifigens TaxID=2057004 RepID=UPI003174EAB9
MSHNAPVHRLLIRVLNVDAEIQAIRNERDAALHWLTRAQDERWTKRGSTQIADCEALVSELNMGIDALVAHRSSLASTLSRLADHSGDPGREVR